MPWWKRWEIWNRIFAVLGIAAAVGYAVITYIQWRDLRHNFQVDERAFIKVEPVWPPSIQELPSDGVFDLKITNVGKSVADQSKTLIWTQVLNRNVPPNYPAPSYASPNTQSILFPGDYSVLEARLYSSSGAPSNITDAEKEDLKAGRSYLAIFGMSTYSDQFGPHWTRFCSWKHYYSGNPSDQPMFQSQSCIPINAIGDGAPPRTLL